MPAHNDRQDGWLRENRGPAAYEQYQVPGTFAPWAERLASVASVGAGDRVLNLGCGTVVLAPTVASL